MRCAKIPKTVLLVLAGALGGLAGGAGGCKAVYEVGVQNNSGRAVSVDVVFEPLLQRQLILGTATVRAGDRVTLGSYAVDPLDPVYLTVRPAGERLDVPERVKLSSGRREYVVEDAGITSWHPVTVRELSNAGVDPRRLPPAEWPEGPR